MNSRFTIFCLLLAIFWPCSLSAEPKADDGIWKIEIVPSRYSKHNGAVLYAAKPLDQFYIVLRNVSGKDQRVWRDWYSWGYDNLSLEVDLAGGSSVMLRKAPKEWGKNYPDSALVPAGKSYVFEVHLKGKS